MWEIVERVIVDMEPVMTWRQADYYESEQARVRTPSWIVTRNLFVQTTEKSNTRLT